MDIMQAIESRHSVREYTDQEIGADIVAALEGEIKSCNEKSGLRIQLVTNEPKAFSGIIAHYGKFRNVKNYIALVGEKGPELDEAIGYYGEKIVLKAQQLGLNTCWVAMSFSRGKSRCIIEKGEKLVCVLALGYGKTQGVPQKSKPMDALCHAEGTMPDWFRAGMAAAMLAPTAVHQQKFLISLADDRVSAKATGGFYSKVDLGIVKLHFEIGAGEETFRWA